MVRELSYISTDGYFREWTLPDDAAVNWHDGMCFVSHSYNGLHIPTKKLGIPIHRIRWYSEKD